MSQPLIDHRGPEFAALLKEVLDGLKTIFQTSDGRIAIFPGSGTAAWEACIVNALSPGDRVLGCVNGHFSALFCRTAEFFGVQVEVLEVPYGAGVSAAQVAERLQKDTQHDIKAVLVVHNETSTGVTSDIAAIRQALDYARHPALFLVDSVSSVGSIDFRFDDWQVDVALAGAQKGLMLPPGLAILAIGERALAASRSARCPRSFWDWTPILERNCLGEFPSTPATVHFFGLKESLAILSEEGLPNVFRRHARLAQSCRSAVQAMGLKLLALSPDEYSNTLTAVCMPDGFDSDAFVAHAHKSLNISLGIGLGKVRGKIFRIGHLGSLNEIELLGALAGVEMALQSFGVNVPVGAGPAAAENYLLETAFDR
ncbi:MAG TPA: aminotransferase class V-fold PLP-dependent enzyme [Candidatus Binatia bacterium]|nr:aminotransferase class V-fold PLP-dependent enzyme [Candidatus Binatia bacterium]